MLIITASLTYRQKKKVCCTVVVNVAECVEFMDQRCIGSHRLYKLFQASAFLKVVYIFVSFLARRLVGVRRGGVLFLKLCWRYC